MLREELEAVKNRPIQIPNLQLCDNQHRETINLEDYKMNHMAFLERVKENIARNRETRWSEIRSIMD